MPLSFPSNPSVGQTSTQSGRSYRWSGYAWELASVVAGHASSHASTGSDPITPASIGALSATGGAVSGQVVVSPNAGPASPDGSVQVVGNGTNANLTVEANSTSDICPTVWFKRSRGTNASPSVVQSGDRLGGFGWRSLRADGTYWNAGYMLMYCAATPATGENTIKSQMVFAVGNGTSQTAALTVSSTSVLASVPLDADATTFRLRQQQTPASSAATGNTGEICWDSNYLYVCVATNTWKRAALSTW